MTTTGRQTQLISVIMPVYNAEKTVERAVKSILRQTLQEFELIMIDDGSVDGTQDLCRQIQAAAPDKVRVCRQENAGPAAARNRGLEAARGSLVCFVDADDTVRPDFLQVMADHIGDAGMAVCGYRTIEEGSPAASGSPSDEESAAGHAGAESANQGEFPAGTESANPGEVPADEEPAAGSPVDEESSAALVCTVSGPAAMRLAVTDEAFGGYLWNKIFRRDLIEQAGIRFEPGIHVGEDLLFVERYLTQCETVCILDRPLYDYYCAAGSISHAMSRKNLTLLRALEKILPLSGDPEFAGIMAVRYTRQFLAFYPYFPKEKKLKGRLDRYLRKTGLSGSQVFSRLSRDYKVRYILYRTSPALYTLSMRAGRGLSR
ncbi:MAG: glycosyltransferase [Lachnospiraceae bacterium]|nr:glycosyltransferase [Lachnospiraceae bacterium]